MTPTPEMIEAGLKAAWENTWKGEAGITLEEFRLEKPAVVDNLTRAVSAALSAGNAAMWPPIGKALRDGTRYFVHCGEYCTIAWWDEDIDDGNGGWTDGRVANWGYQETREVLPVWFIPLSLFEGSWK